VKLYFMVGQPGELESDIDELIELCKKVLAENHLTNRGARVAAHLSPHVPKAQTAFQWEAQASAPVVMARIERIQQALRPLGIAVRFESPSMARIQAVLARGDRRVADALLQTRNLRDWERVLGGCGLDPDFFVGPRDPERELMPWSIVSTGVPEWYLRREHKKARDLVNLPVVA
jgi:radical SAM superfamily enzyme YgiQ (UPF0313 family)